MAAGSNQTNILFWSSQKWVISMSRQTFIIFLKFKLRLSWQQNMWMIPKLGQVHFWTQLPSYVNPNKISFLASALVKPSTAFVKMLLISTNNENIYRGLNLLPQASFTGCSNYRPLPPAWPPQWSHHPTPQSFTKPCTFLLLSFLGLSYAYPP